MISVHPYQHEYFNSLVDKSGLAQRWQMDYWNMAYKEALETALETQPAGSVSVAESVDSYKLRASAAFIPENDRSRLHVNQRFPSFVIVSADQIWRENREDDERPVIRAREVYGVPVVSLLDARAESAAAHRAAYEAARASPPDASAGGFDMYADGGELTYIKEDCADEDTRGRFALSVFPVDRNNLTKWTRDAGLEHEPIRFDFHAYGAIFDGRCVIVQDLPAYPISHVETWRQMDGESRAWSAAILIDESYERYRRALASLSGEPAARSGFDVYLEGDRLIYVKEGCAEDDTRGRFFLSVFPADPRDLPQTARDAGLEHEALNFDFEPRGAAFDGKCVIIRRLPGYPISRVETGQWLPGEGELWSARVSVGD